MSGLPYKEIVNDLEEMGLDVKAQPTQLFLMDNMDAGGFVLAMMASITALGATIGPKVIPQLVDWLLKKHAGHSIKLKFGDEVEVTYINQSKKEIEELIDQHKNRDLTIEISQR